MDLISVVLLVVFLFVLYEYIGGVILTQRDRNKANFEELRKLVKFVSIELIEHKKQSVFLIFDFENQKKFLGQALHADEIIPKLLRDFPGKDIYVDFNDSPVALNIFLKDKLYASTETS
jgi:hypothetical protein